MSPVKYYTMSWIYFRIKRPFKYRIEMIQKVYEIGIKPTAKLFNTIPKTVRKWKKRYEKDGIRGLEDKLRAPKNIPHKVKSETPDI